MYVVNDLNGFDAYILHTVHEPDSVMVRHESTKVYVHCGSCGYIV